MKRLMVLMTALILCALLITACNLPFYETDQISIQSAATMTFAAVEIEIANTKIALLESMASEESPPTATAAGVPTTTPSPTETPTPTPTIEHLSFPAEPPSGRESGVTDANSSDTADENRATRGEDFSRNIYERPFTAEEMHYLPDLDIIRTTLNRMGEWIYIEIELAGENEPGGLLGTYGVELDVDVDGRGDFLILAHDLKSDWSTSGVRVWTDSNHDVGGSRPLISDAPSLGDGYDELLFDSGIGSDPDTAWARIAPNHPHTAQIALKYDLIQRDDAFLWWALTDHLVKDPAKYDYNDHFTHEEAGSPLSHLDQYPLKALAEMDNTCAWSVGFTPDGTEPGLCSLPEEPTVEPEVLITHTPDSSSEPGSVYGRVWIDNNENGAYEPDSDTLSVGLRVTLKNGACGTGGISINSLTNASGNYRFSIVAPGNYCVSIPNLGCKYQTPATNVSVPAGGTVQANFYCQPVQ
ncbi:MAG: hypothetical protein JW750_08590 [Anaerolineaceae bacterium]|nr:hypothetical protein [Anaerolineaceae bacterium]